VRIPFSQPWRAFPELDRFTDEQCVAYVRLAKRERVGSRAIVTFVAGFVSLVMAVVALILTMQFVEEMMYMTRASPRLDVLIAMAMAVAGAGPSGMFFLIVRDRWLRWALRRHIKSAKCPGCGYLLLGLQVQDGAVVCPECGDRLMLTDLGLTPESLLVPLGGQ
jgi:DNA-directed RNA polymerase subunit RPC12/RpoP